LLNPYTLMSFEFFKKERIKSDNISSLIEHSRYLHFVSSFMCFLKQIVVIKSTDKLCIQTT
jgi:hypothetical protein